MPTTLLDIAIMNNSDREVGLIEEVVPYVPEMQIIPARTIEGIMFKTLVRTALPTVGFRDANEGSPISQSVYENRLVEAFIMNPQWQCDQAVADAHEDGPAALLAVEATGMTTAAFITASRQLYYGRDVSSGGDAKGHPGFIQAHDTNMVVDAGGSTAGTGSSVWAVKTGPQAVQWVVGNNGDMTVKDPIIQRVLDKDGKPFDAYLQSMLARLGVMVGSRYSLGRIKKLTADSGKGLTDDLLGALLAKFPVGHKPDVFLMSRRSQEQLRASRTATNATGAPAPLPEDAFGIPIEVTDAISDTEALTL